MNPLGGHLINIPSGESHPPRPLLWEDGLNHTIISRHNLNLETPPAQIIARHDVAVSGEGIATDKHGALMPLLSELPNYVAKVQSDQNLRDKNVASLKTCWHVWHYNCRLYGHWLLEGLPKVLTIKKARELSVYLQEIPFLIPLQAPKFVADHINYLIPDAKICYFDSKSDVVYVECLYGVAWGNGYIYSDIVSDQISKISNYSFDNQRSFIFVSRENVDSYRKLSNNIEIQEVCQEYGFDVVAPENRSFEDQIKLFARAKLIVGEFGSAMHNALFSGPGTKVISLNYITECQSRIGNFRKHDVGYILPEGGPVSFDPSRTSSAEYTINLSEFKIRLDSIISNLS